MTAQSYQSWAADGLSDTERERLILEHLPQVRLIARRIQERLPENISLEDLISTGVIPGVSSMKRFPPQSSATAFLTFAISSLLNMQRRSLCESTAARAQTRRCESCSFDISSEKIAVGLLRLIPI